MRLYLTVLIVVSIVAATTGFVGVYKNEDTSDIMEMSKNNYESNKGEQHYFGKSNKGEEAETALFRKVCSKGKACRRNKGSCMVSPDTCDGQVIDKGCGNNCTCCVKESERCEATKTCKVAAGFCVKGSGSCTGSIIPGGCTGKNCVCCINDNNCPNGFYRVGTECFKVYQELAAWDEARQLCKDHGWELAEPENLPALAQFIYNNISHDDIWIGARGVAGSFKFLSGHSLQGTIPWGIGNPQELTDLGHCLIFHSTNTNTELVSYDCLGRYYFLCEPACPEGFIRSGSGCFKVLAKAQNWESSERDCYEEGLQIAEPEDPKYLAKLLSMEIDGTTYNQHRPYYLGAYRYGQYFWLGARGGRINGSIIAWNSGDPVPSPHPISNTWHPGYPRVKTSGYCIQMFSGLHAQGAMWETPCSGSYYSICEWKCPLGFFRIGKSCYKAYSSSASSWDDARKMCIQDRLTLAEPYNPTAVGDYLFTVTGNHNYWLGGRGDGNRIRWSSGEAIPTNWAPWRPGNPGNKVGTKYCLRLAPEDRTPLTSTACSMELYPLCQK